MIVSSPSEKRPFFKVKSKTQASKPENGEISTVRCHCHILPSPMVVGRAHDSEIERISHFQKEDIY